MKIVKFILANKNIQKQSKTFELCYMLMLCYFGTKIGLYFEYMFLIKWKIFGNIYGLIIDLDIIFVKSESWRNIFTVFVILPCGNKVKILYLLSLI